MAASKTARPPSVGELNLSLTVAFTVGDIGARWLYYLPVLASFEVFVNGGGAWALDRARGIPEWIRS